MYLSIYLSFFYLSIYLSFYLSIFLSSFLSFFLSIYIPILLHVTTIRGNRHLAPPGNALDHSFDPVLGIERMLQVTRPGGWVLLRHARNEGVPGKFRNGGMASVLGAANMFLFSWFHPEETRDFNGPHVIYSWCMLMYECFFGVTR